MFQGCSGVVPGCSVLFRGCSGVFRGCSGVFRECSGFYRHPSKTPIPKKKEPKPRQNFFYLHPKFEIDTNENKMPMARDAENLLQLSPKVLFQRRAKRSSQRAARLCFVLHPCRQYFVPVDRLRIDVKIY